MSESGKSWAGAAGIGSETVYGTGVDVEAWLPATSVGIKPNRPIVARSAIYSSRQRQEQVRGKQAPGGSISLELDHETIGYALKFQNGDIDSDPLENQIANAPTLSQNAGGTLAPGTYMYAVAAIYEDPNTNKRYVGPATANSSPSTIVDTNLTITVTWVNPAPPNNVVRMPTGDWTHVGTAVFRTPVGGQAPLFLGANMSPSATTFVDDGHTALVAGAGVPAAVTRHVYEPPAVTFGEDSLSSFSVTTVMDIAANGTLRLVGCKSDTLAFTFGGGNDIAKADWSIQAQRHLEPIANPSPSFSVLKPVMGWNGYLTSDLSVLATVQSFGITMANNLNRVPGMTGNPWDRDIRGGLRKISGRATLTFENMDCVNAVMHDTETNLVFVCMGEGVASWDSVDVDGYTLYPWPRMMTFEIPSCKFPEAGGALSGADQLTEELAWEARAAAGVFGTYDVRVTLDNTTSSYVAVQPPPMTHVVSSWPDEGMPSWDPAGQPILTFSAPLNEASARTPSNYIFSLAGDPPTPVTLGDTMIYASGETTTVSIVFVGTLAPGIYTLSTLESLVDANMNPVTPYTVHFTVAGT